MLIVRFQNGLKRCVFSKRFSKVFLTGNRLQDSGNRLHNYILKGHDFSKCFLKFLY